MTEKNNEINNSDSSSFCQNCILPATWLNDTLFDMQDRQALAVAYCCIMKGMIDNLFDKYFDDESHVGKIDIPEIITILKKNMVASTSDAMTNESQDKGVSEDSK